MVAELRGDHIKKLTQGLINRVHYQACRHTRHKLRGQRATSTTTATSQWEFLWQLMQPQTPSLTPPRQCWWHVGPKFVYDDSAVNLLCSVVVQNNCQGKLDLNSKQQSKAANFTAVKSTSTIIMHLNPHVQIKRCFLGNINTLMLTICSSHTLCIHHWGAKG